MKYICYILLVCAVLVSCNKDEEIIVSNPEPDSQDGQFEVMEYLPAPGQFINEKASGFLNVTTMAEACEYAQGRLATNDFVSLGAWGGRITVRSSAPIPNTGGYDFSIAGNAFDTSSEPGIVWVMKDENGNGLPDDTWYELKGSFYGQEGFEKNYSVTYFRPEKEKEDVRWVDSNGASGVVKWLTYHSQASYFPAWVEGASYTLEGSRLPAQAEQNPQTGVWVNKPFKWGYADNLGDDSAILDINGKTVQMNYFKISDAVGTDGREAKLPSIDFIKVQTAVNNTAGVIGECSTEVCGFYVAK